MTKVHGISVTGGSFPAQIWQKFMNVADRDYPEAQFAKPAAVAVYDPLFRSTYATFPTSTTTSSTTTTLLPPPVPVTVAPTPTASPTTTTGPLRP